LMSFLARENAVISPSIAVTLMKWKMIVTWSIADP